VKAKRKPAAKKATKPRRVAASPRPRSQSESAQATIEEAGRLFHAQERKTSAQSAAEHFLGTLGEVPASVQALIDLAPGALPGYVALREYAYGGALDRRTVELLFTVLDVVQGHTEAAKAHVEEGVRAGLTVAQLAEALTVAMMVCGVSTFATSGHHVLRHAAAVAEKRA
jgi:alkylhydroperoxidase/carboxymuconolactone decarboxylase family protein YurZ